MRLLMPALFLSLFLAGVLHAQSPKHRQIQLNFNPVYERTALLIDSPGLYIYKGQPIVFETFKCYISQVGLYYKGKEIFAEPNSYHLLDATIPNSLKLLLPVADTLLFDEMRFSVGLDSATNCSGALGGDLSPLKGMYWTWQSGYINFKLEGVSPVSLALKHGFTFHLGGYNTPFQTIQMVRLKVKAKPVIGIGIALSDFLKSIDMATMPSVMSPGKDAVMLSKLLPSIFYIEDEN